MQDSRRLYEVLRDGKFVLLAPEKAKSAMHGWQDRVVLAPEHRLSRVQGGAADQCGGGQAPADDRARRGGGLQDVRGRATSLFATDPLATCEG